MWNGIKNFSASFLPRQVDGAVVACILGGLENHQAQASVTGSSARAGTGQLILEQSVEQGRWGSCEQGVGVLRTTSAWLFDGSCRHEATTICALSNILPPCVCLDPRQKGRRQMLADACPKCWCLVSTLVHLSALALRGHGHASSGRCRPGCRGCGVRFDNAQPCTVHALV